MTKDIRQMYKLIWALLGLATMFFFQSCANPKLKTEVVPKSQILSEPPKLRMIGITSGKIQFQTNDLMSIYEDGVISFLNSPDPLVRRMIDQIPLQTKFYLQVLSKKLSGRSRLQINDDFNDIFENRKKYGSTFSLSGSNGTTKLNNLNLHLVNGPDCIQSQGALTLRIVEATALPPKTLMEMSITCGS